MFQQLQYFGKDLRRMVGHKKERYIYIWLSRPFWGLLSYRLDRGLFLLIGRPYRILRILLLPVYTIWQVYSNIEIGYRANIGPGIKILHSATGIVISELADIGANLTMIGGNIIGGKRGCKPGGIKIGDGCYLSANATIVGPVTLGNQVIIGANACVVKSFPQDKAVLVGVPAAPIVRKPPEQ
jgi:serine O-acetyltransferase